ncbi:hypothetical protein FOC1_g10000148, partial [Fusarium oxysporum f. sp. cubense race 1]
RTLESLTKSLGQCNSISTRLFPGHDISVLLPLSRQELYELLDNPTPCKAAEVLPSPSCSPPKDSLNLGKKPAQDNRAIVNVSAIIRMASALGLHREPAGQDGKILVAVELRRRTWLSLVCPDTRTTTTLGHPPFGHCGPPINTQPPRLSIEQEDQDSILHTEVVYCLHNIRLSKIATEIYDILALIPSQNP